MFQNNINNNNNNKRLQKARNNAMRLAWVEGGIILVNNIYLILVNVDSVVVLFVPK